MHFDYIKALHSPLVWRFSIGKLLKEQSGEIERALDSKLEILVPRAGCTASSPDTLHKHLPSLGLSLPICTMSNWSLKSGYLSKIYLQHLFLHFISFPFLTHCLEFIWPLYIKRMGMPHLSMISSWHMCGGGEATWNVGYLFLDRLLSVSGTKGRKCPYTRRLFGPLLQKAISFWAAAIEGRVSVSVDFMVQLGTRGFFRLYPNIFPEPWFYTLPLSSHCLPSTLEALFICIGGG